MAGDFSVVYTSGGVIDRIKRIDLPERIAPEVNTNKSKGFFINTQTDPNVNDMFTVDYTIDKDIYLTTINLMCSDFDEGDYWELFINDRSLCETMYLLDTVNVQVNFTFYEKTLADSNITFKYFNSTGEPKKIAYTLSYVYNNG